jgi:hypothetical protein
MTTAQNIFSNLPVGDPFGFYQDGKTNYGKVIELLDFKREDVSRATHTPLASIRLDRLPREVQERIEEWAYAYTLVASHFKDVHKTVLWFKMPNPLLGNLSPRDMIRFSRYKKLIKFIQSSLSENVR